MHTKLYFEEVKSDENIIFRINIYDECSHYLGNFHMFLSKNYKFYPTHNAAYLSEELRQISDKLDEYNKNV